MINRNALKKWLSEKKTGVIQDELVEHFPVKNRSSISKIGPKYTADNVSALLQFYLKKGRTDELLNAISEIFEIPRELFTDKKLGEEMEFLWKKLNMLIEEKLRLREENLRLKDRVAELEGFVSKKVPGG